jgi:hypothetical protein
MLIGLPAKGSVIEKVVATPLGFHPLAWPAALSATGTFFIKLSAGFVLVMLLSAIALVPTCFIV